MNIERALLIQGWMTELELQYLAETASKSRVIAEVGSWAGRSTCALAANTDGVVFAVDTWKGNPELMGMLAEHEPGWIYNEFRRNTEGLPIAPVPTSSLDAALAFSKLNARFDLVFIDANHTYESVKADIAAWMPLLADGGILCGHDFDPPNWMGIHAAVKECVPAFRIVPGTTIWSTEER